MKMISNTALNSSAEVIYIFNFRCLQAAEAPKTGIKTRTEDTPTEAIRVHQAGRALQEEAALTVAHLLEIAVVDLILLTKEESQKKSLQAQNCL